jgi:hypothetical protein
VRQARAGPKLNELHQWLIARVKQLSKKSDLAGAIHYALARRKALTRYRDDGRIEIDNNAAERALRAVALGRKNYLFAGADSGGASAPPRSTRSSAPPSSTASIRRPTCVMCLPTSRIIRSIALMNCYPGTWHHSSINCRSLPSYHTAEQ